MVFRKRHHQASDMNYSDAYSISAFWKVVRKLSKRSSQKVASVALTLYFCLRDPETPTWAKSVIIGALGYLIFPMDFIPDAIPGVGFTDDWGAIIAAMSSVIAHVKAEHREKAALKVAQLFGKKVSGEADEEFPEASES